MNLHSEEAVNLPTTVVEDVQVRDRSENALGAPLPSSAQSLSMSSSSSTLATTRPGRAHSRLPSVKESSTEPFVRVPNRRIEGRVPWLLSSTDK